MCTSGNDTIFGIENFITFICTIFLWVEYLNFNRIIINWNEHSDRFLSQKYYLLIYYDVNYKLYVIFIYNVRVAITLYLTFQIEYYNYYKKKKNGKY